MKKSIIYLFPSSSQAQIILKSNFQGEDGRQEWLFSKHFFRMGFLKEAKHSIFRFKFRIRVTLIYLILHFLPVS